MSCSGAGQVRQRQHGRTCAVRRTRHSARNPPSESGNRGNAPAAAGARVVDPYMYGTALHRPIRLCHWFVAPAKFYFFEKRAKVNENQFWLEMVIFKDVEFSK